MIRHLHMARKRGGANLSAEIRKYVASNPNAKPKAVSEGLAANGVKVTPTYVSTILSNERRKSGKRKRRGRRGAARQGDVLANLVLAKRLSDKMGGIDQARAASESSR